MDLADESMRRLVWASLNSALQGAHGSKYNEPYALGPHTGLPSVGHVKTGRKLRSLKTTGLELCL